MPMITFKVNPEYAKITEIVPGLFICGVSSLNPLPLARYGITYIINATTEVPHLKSLSNIQWTKLWIDDAPQTYIYPHLELQSDQIRAIIADDGKVLVHCVAGVSRSATICLAYLTKYHCRTLRDAYHLMARKRPLVRPNIGFWRQLISFEQNVKGTFGSVRLVRDETQENALLPDVYLKEIIQKYSETSENCETKIESSRRKSYAKLKDTISLSRPRFHPVLESLPELVEAAVS